MIVSHTLDISGGEYVAALGTFDGVHIGHRGVIDAALRSGLPVAVVTSDVNPRAALGGCCGRILSPTLCDEELERLGVSAVVRLDFNSIRSLAPEQYLDMLRDGLRAHGFVCGFNFRFGKNAVGTPATLSQYATAHDCFFSECAEVDIDGGAVSSSRIRDAIACGDMQAACRLLGRCYAIDFDVIHGDARGRTLGFPTANQVYGDEYIVPRHGVYASDVTVNGVVYRSVTNIGTRPTFCDGAVVAETHVIGADVNLYGKKIKVELLARLRDEIKFSSANDLIRQVERDKAASLDYKR